MLLARVTTAGICLAIGWLITGGARAATFEASDTQALVMAMERAEARPGPDVIRLVPSQTYERFAQYSEGVALPVVTDDLHIRGNGSTLKWAAQGSASLFHVAGPGHLRIDKLTLMHAGRSAITVDGRLTTRASTFRGNRSGSAGGGALMIAESGVARVFRTTFEENVAVGQRGVSDGGAISNRGVLYARGASFRNNRTQYGFASGKSGESPTAKPCGICATRTPDAYAIKNTGRARLVNTFIEDDYGVTGRSSVINQGTFRLVNATVSSTPLTNSEGGRFTAVNSAILGTTGCENVRSLGFNVTTGFCLLNRPTDSRLAVSERGLQPDIRRAGGIPARYPARESPLLDNANPDRCPAVDIAGRSRPLDGNHDGEARCDIGAAEFRPRGYAIDGRVNGLWYEPDRDGHYLLVERTARDRVTVFWATYDEDGNPLWLFGSGAPSGGRVTVPLITQHGMRFGVFDDNQLVVSSWGELSLAFEDCANLEMTWAAEGRPGLDGEASLTRLTQIHGHECLP